MSEPSLEFDPIDDLADSFLERYRRGERPSLSEYTDRHPELAERIRAVFPALIVMETVGAGGSQGTGLDVEPFGSGVPMARRLGDFVLLRRVGAGGMGIVYEAEHASLKSRMALKVMHPRFRADRDYVRRFQTEARSAAKLHHTNIVSVFGYGEQDGVCYYAMQYIVGVGLERVLDDVRRLRAASGDIGGGTKGEGNGAAIDAETDLLTAVSRGMVSGRFVNAPSASHVTGADSTLYDGVGGEAHGMNCGERTRANGSATAPTDGRADSDSSSLAGQTGSIYFREVARLGAQVADALEHAHRQGVIHRDIKPSNLLLDIRGNVWVTDFGLAKLVEGDELSQSHDLIGTLRFMAPERFRGLTDPLGDVYSLGATLYELLTLKPAFPERNQARLIDQIARESPVPLRQHDHRIPRDLETLVLKALAKEPKDRFATAAEFGNEMERYLESRPIHSRPVGPVERVWRWCKRSPGLAGASIGAALLTVIMLIGSIGAAWTFRTQRDQIRRADRETRENLVNSLEAQARATRFSRQVGQRFEALRVVEQALGIARELKLPPARFDALRNEAIACLALPDMRKNGRVINRPPGLRLFAFDPTMTRYALRFRDGTIQVKNVDQDREVARFQAHGDRDVHVFAFSPNGRYLATTHAPGDALTVWDIDQKTTVLNEPRSVMWGSAKFSPDSRSIALALADGEFVIHDLENGRPRRSWRGPVAEYPAYSPDGARIAVIYNGKNPTWRIFESESGRLVQSFPLPAATVSSAWSPDGTILALGSDDLSIYLHDVATGARKATLTGTTNGGILVGYHPAGTLLASEAWDGRLRLWDAVRGRPVLSCASGGFTNSLQFSRDGRVTILVEDQLITYDVDPALEYRSFVRASDLPLAPMRASIRRDGRLVALGTDRGVVLWDLASGREVAYLPIGLAWHLMFEASGDLLTSGSSGTLRWRVELDLDNRRFRIGPPSPLRFPPSNAGIDEDRSGLIIALAMHTYAVVQNSGRIKHVSPLDDCRSVAVSPDGQWLATGSHGHNGAHVWRIDNDQRVADLAVEGLVHVAFSPDGKWLMTTPPPCKLWSVGTWREERQIGGAGLCFSPDGRYMLVKETSAALRVVETESGRSVARLESPDSCDVNAATFSPDGARLVVTTTDGGAAHVWDLRAIRRRLATIGLDWDAPAYSNDDPAGPAATPLPPFQVDLGLQPATSSTSPIRRKH
jgi:eukaryotic-like serine/threonine-protein kinase